MQILLLNAKTLVVSDFNCVTFNYFPIIITQAYDGCGDPMPTIENDDVVILLILTPCVLDSFGIA